MHSDGIKNVTTTNVLAAHLSDVSGNGNGTIARNELKSLMESYWGRVSKEQRVPPFRVAWLDLWEKAACYLPREDMMAIGEAFVYASDCHNGQKRRSGEPYAVHPVSVAAILARLRLDKETLIAALLHDVLEDTPVDDETIAAKYGKDVLVLVSGVTKLGKLMFSSFEDYQAENLRKMFVVMAKDIRVVLIKLADRLHNMRTIASHRREKQVRIARETLEIYAPLAHRLGIYQVKRDLEDLSFRVIDPEMYYDIKRRVRKKLPEREMIIKEAMNTLLERLVDSNISGSIKGRPKHFYSIFEKMKRKHLALEQLYDLLALRVIVHTVEECYQVLGIVHIIWKPIPGQFDDYIANPKNNMYQSLHTTVVGPSGEPLEVQIRTEEMNDLAEYGVAAHWNYKEGGSSCINNLDKGLTWIRQALEEGMPDPNDNEQSKGKFFMDNLKTDVLTSEVFVFTPKGEVISIPNGSTPIDFAYAIHTEVGHKCVGAMVNSRIAPMDQKLRNGDIVRILTSPQAKPSRDWLKIAKAARTRHKIKAWFRQRDRQVREEKIKRGTELLEKEAKRRYPNEEKPLEHVSTQLSTIAREMGYGNTEDMIVSVGNGTHTASSILGRINTTHMESKEPVNVSENSTSSQERKESDDEIVVEGASGVLVTIARCCFPVPGDSIEGRVTKAHGISVHRSDCNNLKNADEERLVPVSWGRKSSKSTYTARVRVEGTDRPRLFGDIVQTISTMDANMSNVKASVVNGSRARIILELQVRNLEHLYSIIAQINTVSGVMEVIRG